jgi:hypothetical protein
MESRAALQDLRPTQRGPAITNDSSIKASDDRDLDLLTAQHVEIVSEEVEYQPARSAIPYPEQPRSDLVRAEALSIFGSDFDLDLSDQ